MIWNLTKCACVTVFCYMHLHNLASSLKKKLIKVYNKTSLEETSGFFLHIRSLRKAVSFSCGVCFWGYFLPQITQILGIGLWEEVSHIPMQILFVVLQEIRGS